MIEVKIKGIKNLVAFMKSCQSKALTSALLSSGLTLTLSIIPVSAKKTTIESIYFNTDHSVVIETESKSSLKFLPASSSNMNKSLQIIDAKLAHGVGSNLSNQNFNLEIVKRNGNLELSFHAKSGALANVTPRAILDGLAYELDFSQQVLVPEAPALVNDVPLVIPELAVEPSTTDLHQLSAEASEHKIYTITQSKSEIDKFIEGLDDQLALRLEADHKFQEETFHKIDSASLTHLADILAAKGYQAEALAAYRRALELNAENINAKLGLAEITPDANEKLANYLTSVSDKALMEIGSSWFKQAQESHDLKSVAKALVSFQFAVLKDPRNAEYRYRYAQVLENAGVDFWEQAGKRYLEAAALAKTEYIAGNRTNELLLRDATESLIRVLSKQGEFQSAAKYCTAYINLGFQKFMNGKSVLAVLKEVEANRNPFSKEPNA